MVYKSDECRVDLGNLRPGVSYRVRVQASTPLSLPDTSLSLSPTPLSLSLSLSRSLFLSLALSLLPAPVSFLSFSPSGTSRFLSDPSRSLFPSLHSFLQLSLSIPTHQPRLLNQRVTWLNTFPHQPPPRRGPKLRFTWSVLLVWGLFGAFD